MALSHLALAPFQVSGPPGARVVQPRGDLGPEWAVLDLRPPAGEVGYGIVATRERVPGLEYLGALGQFGRPARAMRAALQSRLGVVLAGVRAQDWLLDLYLNHAGGRRRWRPLSADGGAFTVWLGGVCLASRPIVAGGAEFTESFNTADSGTLGPDLTWTELGGNLQIVSNQLRITSAAVLCFARAEHDVGGADMFTEVAIHDLDGSAQERIVAVGVRCNSGNVERYDFVASTTSSNAGTWSLRRRLVGSAVTLATNSDLGALLPLAGLPKTLRGEISGSSISGFYDGTLRIGPTTDTNYTTPQRGTIGLQAGFVASTPIVDSFKVGLLAAAPSQRRSITLTGVG